MRLLHVRGVVVLGSAALLGAAAHIPASAQSDAERSTLAPIVRTERGAAGVVRVVYNLSGAAGALFSVALEASADGGQTFAIRPRAITGDVGPGVSPGTGKTIAWDTTKDVEDLQLDRFVFRVVISGGGQPAATSSGDAAPAAAQGPGRGGAPAPGASPRAPSSGRAKRGGGLSTGALLAIAGGGAAVGVAVAAKGSASGPTTTSKTFTATISAPMVFQFTLCRRVETWSGTLVMVLDVSPTGNVTGSSSTSATTRVDSLTPVANCPQEQVGGSGRANLPSTQVTGTTDRLLFSGKTFVGPTVAGDLSYDWTFSGRLASDVVTGVLDWTATFAGSGVGTGTFNVTAR